MKKRIKLFFHCFFLFHRSCKLTTPGQPTERWCHDCNPNKWAKLKAQFIIDEYHDKEKSS